jgi:tetratricopeptide (TPR) repeat protein
VLPEETEAAFIARGTDPGAAERAIDELLSREPTHVLAHLCKGVILSERQEYREALPYARYVTEETPMIYKAWHVRGLGELLMGSPAEARNSFMHYVSFETADPTGYCYIALTYAREENAELALRFLDQISETGVVKDLSALTYTRALIEEEAGDLRSALMHFIEIQMTAPDTFGAHASFKA